MATGCYYFFHWPKPYVYLLEIVGLIRYATFVLARHLRLLFAPSHQPKASEDEIRYAMETRERLPVVGYASYLKRKGVGEGSIDGACSICMSSLEWSDEVRELEYCCHAFHRDCLDSWLDEGKITCPLCRSMLSSNEAVVADEQ